MPSVTSNLQFISHLAYSKTQLFVPRMRKPFDILAEGLLSENGGGNKTAIELFMAGGEVEASVEAEGRPPLALAAPGGVGAISTCGRHYLYLHSQSAPIKVILKIRYI